MCQASLCGFSHAAGRYGDTRIRSKSPRRAQVGALASPGFPDPDLIVRTGGEQRISNFLLWEIAYAELWFTPVLWPDFRKEHLFQAVLDFQHRERRFGLTREQLPAS